MTNVVPTTTDEVDIPFADDFIEFVICLSECVMCFLLVLLARFRIGPKTFLFLVCLHFLVYVFFDLSRVEPHFFRVLVHSFSPLVSRMFKFSGVDKSFLKYMLCETPRNSNRWSVTMKWKTVRFSPHAGIEELPEIRLQKKELRTIFPVMFPVLSVSSYNEGLYLLPTKDF